MFTIKDDVSLISSLSRTFENSLLIINKI
jgi:hypothetical protein